MGSEIKEQVDEVDDQWQARRRSGGSWGPNPPPSHRQDDPWDLRNSGVLR